MHPLKFEPSMKNGSGFGTLAQKASIFRFDSFCEKCRGSVQFGSPFIKSSCGMHHFHWFILSCMHLYVSISMGVLRLHIGTLQKAVASQQHILLKI